MLVLKPPAGRRVEADELAFAPAAIAARGHGVTLWTAFADGARAERIPLPNDSWAGAPVFAPDGRSLFVSGFHLFALDVETRVVTHVPTDEWHTYRYGVSPDGTRLIVSEMVRGIEANMRLACWAFGDYAAPLWRGHAGAHALGTPLFPPDGRTFVQLEHAPNAAARRWRTRAVMRGLDTGRVVAESAFYPDHPHQVVPSPDGATLACCIRERIYAGPADGNVTAASVANDTKKHFTGIAFHPGGRYLAATSNDATVKLYDTATWELARTFTWDVGRMRSVAFSPDGTLAAAGSDTGKVVVWDVDL